MHFAVPPVHNNRIAALLSYGLSSSVASYSSYEVPIHTNTHASGCLWGGLGFSSFPKGTSPCVLLVSGIKLPVV